MFFINKFEIFQMMMMIIKIGEHAGEVTEMTKERKTRVEIQSNEDTVIYFVLLLPLLIKICLCALMLIP